MPLPSDIHFPEANEFAKEREADIIGVIGRNRTGKSSTVVELAERWSKARPKNTIVAHDPQSRFGHIADIEIESFDDDWAKKCLKLTNALIILDELRMLHEPSIMNKDFVKLCSMAFENSVDIVYIVHHPGMVLTKLTYFTTKYVIFATEAKLGAFKDKIPNYLQTQAACNYVNKYTRFHGTGKHKLDPEYDGQGFPHIIVDNRTGKLTGINMSKKKRRKIKV